MAKKLTYAELLVKQLLTEKKINFVTGYVFSSEHKYAFDFAILDKKIAVEVEGNIWHKGGHTSAYGVMRDCKKYNIAQLLGWKVIRIPVPWLNDKPTAKNLKYFDNVPELLQSLTK